MWFSVTLGAAGSGRDFGAEVSTALVAERAYAGRSDPYFIVHHLSQFLVLGSGDLFSTGTLRGVGVGRSPQVWLQPGDVVTLGVDGLGAQRQTAMGPW